MKNEYENIISEELLAAYKEGKTDLRETLMVLEALTQNIDLQEEYIISQQLDAMMSEASYEPDIIPMAAYAAENEDNLCDFMCEEYILQLRSIPYQPSTLTEEAKNNRWLHERGTPLYNVGRILEQYDLIVMRQYRASLDDIIRALNANHNIIAIVNNNKLNKIDSKHIAYHAVVPIEIDKSTIKIYNPADGGKIANYPISLFESAWSDAQSYIARVKSKDYNYNPRPIDLDDIELSSDLIDLREAIAENAHEVWADKRQEEGWVYGPERNDTKREHPDMIPYSMLPDSEKEYDRAMAFNTIKLMKKLGYDIIKRDNSETYLKLIDRIAETTTAQKCECGADIFADQLYCEQCGKKICWKKWR